MFNEMLNMLGDMSNPRTCINCNKPLEEGDQGFPTGIPNANVCTPCEEARWGMMYDIQGAEITYRDGTTERIGE